MSRFDATLSLTMILAVLVVLGYAIVRPAPRPTPQPEIMSSETPSPLVSLANGIAAEAWIGAPEASVAVKAGQVALSPPPAASGAPRQQLAGRGGKPDTTPQPSPRLRTPVPAVGARVTAAPTRRSVSGLATWYCCTRGHSAGEYVAAAGPALRMGSWRGRIVQVCAARCIRVRLVDFCGCPWTRVIDLHRGPFAALGPLSRGVLRVRVSW